MAVTLYTAGGLPILGDHASLDHDVTVGGQWKARGYVPRDYSVQPSPMRKVDIKTIPRSEWPERIRDQKAGGYRLSDVRDRMDNGNRAKSYDQNGQGYCWFYSVTAAATLLRATQKLPYVRLSAHSGASKIKNFADQGGWCGLAMEFIQKNGVVPESHWPAKARDRSLDNAANWEEAKKYVVTEGWVDLDVAVYDRNLTVDQVATFMLTCVPGAFDFNHWGHSVCWLDLVEGATLRDTVRDDCGKLLDLPTFDLVMGMNDERTAGFAFSLWNSWTDQWGEAGVGLLTGSKMIPDGAVALTTMLAA
jgi:hypothetical protein